MINSMVLKLIHSFEIVICMVYLFNILDCVDSGIIYKIFIFMTHSEQFPYTRQKAYNTEWNILNSQFSWNKIFKIINNLCILNKIFFFKQIIQKIKIR